MFWFGRTELPFAPFAFSFSANTATQLHSHRPSISHRTASSTTQATNQLSPAYPLTKLGAIYLAETPRASGGGKYVPERLIAHCGPSLMQVA